MPILQGKWYFKNTLDKENISTNISFSFFVNANTTHSGSIIAMGYTEAANYLYYYTDTQVPVYMNGTWANQAYRSIEITNPTEVSEEFYNWFTKNAVPLTIEKGVWRFNKHLKGTGEIVGTVDPHDSTNSGEFNFGVNYARMWCFTNCIPGDKNSIHSLTYEYIDDDPTGLEVYTSTDGWVDDSYRTIEIVEPLEAVNGNSAIWFYENAHSMELKLYSECYIAEASDVLKSYTKATGYTIKDFAEAIDSLGSKFIEGDFEKY